MVIAVIACNIPFQALEVWHKHTSEDVAKPSQDDVEKASGSQGAVRKRLVATTIDPYFSKGSKGPVKYLMKSDQQMKADMAVATYVATDKLPAKFVESEPFQELITILQSPIARFRF